MSKFKVGDKVKCVKKEDFLITLTKGKIYRIIYVNDYLVHIINDLGNEDYFHETRFSHIDDNAINRLLYPEAFSEV